MNPAQVKRTPGRPRIDVNEKATYKRLAVRSRTHELVRQLAQDEHTPMLEWLENHFEQLMKRKERRGLPGMR